MMNEDMLSPVQMSQASHRQYSDKHYPKQLSHILRYQEGGSSRDNSDIILDFHNRQQSQQLYMATSSEYLNRSKGPQVAVETEMIQRLRGLQIKLTTLVKKLMKKSKVTESTNMKPLVKMSLGKNFKQLKDHEQI